MILQQLSSLIKGIVQPLGYTFHLGQKTKINSTLKKFPTSWLELPSLESIEGRESGTVTYSVSMYLIHKADREDALETITTLENDAFTLLSSLEQDKRVRELTKAQANIEFYLFPPLLDATIHIEFQISMDFNALNK